jgi:uncharacterized protein (DUF2141 family)
MKITIILIVLIAIGNDLPAQETRTGKLTVTVNNIRSDSGKVRIALFNSPETHLKDSFRSEKKPAKGHNGIFIFDQLPYGEYSFTVHHDENANGNMDKNLLGIPKEGYAFSNDAGIFFGAPSYESCLFKLESSELKVEVELDY